MQPAGLKRDILLELAQRQAGVDSEVIARTIGCHDAIGVVLALVELNAEGLLRSEWWPPRACRDSSVTLRKLLYTITPAGELAARQQAAA